MLTNIVKLEVKVGEKIYHLLCDSDSPIEHVKEAIFQLTKVVAEIEEKIVAAKKEAESKQAEKLEQEEKPNE